MNRWSSFSGLSPYHYLRAPASRALGRTQGPVSGGPSYTTPLGTTSGPSPMSAPTPGSTSETVKLFMRWSWRPGSTVCQPARVGDLVKARESAPVSSRARSAGSAASMTKTSRRSGADHWITSSSPTCLPTPPTSRPGGRQVGFSSSRGGNRYRITATGDREVPSVEVGDSGDGVFWTSFSAQPACSRAERSSFGDLSPPPEAQAVIQAVVVGSAWQRCRAHFPRINRQAPQDQNQLRATDSFRGRIVPAGRRTRITQSSRHTRRPQR